MLKHMLHILLILKRAINEHVQDINPVQGWFFLYLEKHLKKLYSQAMMLPGSSSH